MTGTPDRKSGTHETPRAAASAKPSESTPGGSGRRTNPALPVCDAAAVLAFAVLGRAAHGEGLGLGEVWSTAWPFLIGAGVGWLGVAATRTDPLSGRAGAMVWAPTLVVGLTVYGLREGKIPHWSFAIVAGTTTALLLFGWRFVARRRVRSRRL